MAPKRPNSHPVPSPIPIGNCQVTVQAKNFSFESNQNSLQISLSRYSKVNISVADDVDKKGSSSEEKGDCYFMLLSPKDVDDQSKSMLQDVVNIYMKELPAMNYAANTGKKSKFLERCVSNGKFCTLLLKSFSAEGCGEVISAITYQIIPADTLYAEVPLAAVSLAYQLKGIGCLMYSELRRRLQSIGVQTIFCWGDEESEGFWHKQGFVPVGEVNTKGRARRLPIKADVRKALCFPGGSTLMVSHLSKNMPANPTEHNNLSLPQKLLEKSLSPTVAHHQGQGGCQDMISLEDVDCINMDTGLGLTEVGTTVDGKHYPCSTIGEKKRVWEASCTSLKSKKVKGGHLEYCELDCSDFIESGGRSLITSKADDLMDVAPRGVLSYTCLEKQTEEHKLIKPTTQDHGIVELLPIRKRIMLMNIADDAKQARLIKIIEELGGVMTTDGSDSTHVITRKVRKTKNFCTALCSGAWVISPSWLKESCCEGRFVDETPFMLQDEEYELKYGIELKVAVLRTKASPQALFKGYDVCFAAHVQPPPSTLSTIVRTAGGNVIRGIENVKEASKTIFVASEVDIEEALSAVKEGIWTFSADWFMNCIMKQELDLDAPQFAESL